MNIGFYQEGGPIDPQEETQDGMAPEDGGDDHGGEAPAGGHEAQGGQDPLMQLAQIAAQALQTKNCDAAMQVCQAFVQLLQHAQGGGAAQPEGEPVYRRGGTLVRRIRK